MPFSRPTLTELIQQALADVQRVLRLPAVLRFSPEAALAKASAGLTNGLYGFLDWIARMDVPMTAEGEFLEAWGNLVGITRKPATFAAGSATFYGATGSTMPAGTVINRSDGTAVYTVDADAAVGVSGAVTVAITATTGGPLGNALDGTPLSLQGAVTGISSAGVSGILTGGFDEELDEQFRARMLERWAAPPQGGDVEDYRQWALAVPGVTRAWVNPLGAGAGTVIVYTMFDIANAAYQGFPQGTNGVATAEARWPTKATGDQLAVADAIYPLRPVTALVFSLTPIAFPVAFTIHPARFVPDDIKAQVAAALDRVFVAYATPLSGELQTSVFESAIAAIPGMPDFTLTAPTAAIIAPLGYLPVRGAVTYA